MKTTAAAVVLLATALATPAWSDVRLLGDGSGVVIGPHEILTANHVIDRCSKATIEPGGDLATVKARDTYNDLAVLHVQLEMSGIVAFRSDSEPSIRIGDEVIVMGYPLQQSMALTPSLTIGNVSAMAGYKNNANSYTITAPIQPGNSGGPLLDSNGHLIGIITSTLTDAQNVNFAVKREYIKEFLRANYFDLQTATTSNAKVTPADIGEKARLFTVKINCYVEPDTAAMPTSPPSSQPPPSQPPPAQSGGGYWTTTVNDNSCTLTSNFTDGRALGLGLTRDFGLIALIAKPSWSIPQGVRVAASVQIDGYPPLSGPGMALPEFPNTIAIQVQPRFYNALVYQMIEGWWATVRFTGNELPWQVSLWGVKAAWPAFLQCARRVSPMFVKRLYDNSTQPW